MPVNLTCLICEKTFSANAAHARTGRAKYCSRKCQSIAQSQQRIPLEDRFWAKVEKTDGCWLWTAFRDKHGYGHIQEGPRCGRKLRASHVSWVIHYGPVPDDACVLHKCDNPPCVRPDHLFLGSQSDNTADMRAKGRGVNPPPSPIGTANANAKVTPDIVRRIRADARASPEVAAEFGISPATVRQIRRRVTWKHVPD